eukprot:5791225-Amphidinium_carterae.1
MLTVTACRCLAEENFSEGVRALLAFGQCKAAQFQRAAATAATEPECRSRHRQQRLANYHPVRTELESSHKGKEGSEVGLNFHRCCVSVERVSPKACTHKSEHMQTILSNVSGDFWGDVAAL